MEALEDKLYKLFPLLDLQLIKPHLHKMTHIYRD